MSHKLILPRFGKFIDALNAAGVKTGSARGFWGGVTEEGEIVVTSWIEQNDGEGRFYFWKPNTNHGQLKAQWDVGNIQVGSEVKMILLRRKKENEASIAAAGLTEGSWRVVEIKLVPDGDKQSVRGTIERF